MFGFGKKSVTLRHTDEGSHGDHWRAIFGFTDDGLGSRIESIVEDLQVSGTQREINRVVARHDAFSALGIQSGNDLATLYPVAEQRETIAVTIREIIEWRHVGGLEAQIVGRGKDTFGLNFFAVDYFENQAAYLRGGPVTVQLAALAYLVEPAADLPAGFDRGFCCYLPNPDMSGGHDFNFIGDIISLTPTPSCGEELISIRVKLINDPDQPDFFNLPLLANRKNLRSPVMQPGDKVSGCFWLQGRLAD